MKLIINVPAELHAEAFALLQKEIKRIESYDRPGWGWAFSVGDKRMFVCGIKGGLSVRMAK